jgi:hypothetical protein
VVVVLRRQLRAGHRGGRRQCKDQDHQAAVTRERPRPREVLLGRSCRSHVALEGCHGMHRPPIILVWELGSQ